MALNKEITKYRNPRYIESEIPSEYLAVGTLLTPTISFNKNFGIIGWGNLDPEAQYIVFYKSTDSVNYVEFARSEITGENTRDLKGDQDANVFNFNTTYTIKIKVVAVLNGQEYSSALSLPTESFTITKLNAPVLSTLSANTAQYYWNSVSNANKYRLYGTLNDAETDIVTKTILEADRPTQGNTINLDYSRNGTYTLYVDAINDEAPFLYRNSEQSNREVYNAYKLGTPVITSFVADDNYMTWDPVNNADRYKIYLNDVLIDTVASNNYDFTSAVADLVTQGILDFTAYIKATNVSQSAYPNPKYNDSDNSIITSWGVLRTPIISLSNNIITIDNFDLMTNVEYFEVWDYGSTQNPTEPISRMSPTSSVYILRSNEPRTFNIRIKACSEDPNITDSSLSNNVTFIIERLKTPTINSSTTDKITTITCQYILNADYYEFYKGDGTLIKTVRRTGSQTYSTDLELPSGYNNIYMIAKSDNPAKYLDSYPSNTISVNQLPTEEYKVYINDIGYDIILPFEITKTLDETMDIASVTLAAIDNKEPFEAYTEIKISIGDYESDSGSYTNKNGFPLYMIISEDDVEEVPIGNISKYKHHLSLIERTKLLECEFLPDISITQPMEYTIAVNQKVPDVSIKPKYGENNELTIWGSETNQLRKKIGWSQRRIPIGTKNKYTTGLKNQKLTGNINQFYDKREIKEINLPVELADSFDIENIYVYSTLFFQQSETNIYNSLKDENIRISKTYKYRQHGSNTEYNILTTTDSSIHKWNIENLDDGYYDIILELSIDQAAVGNILKDNYSTVSAQDYLTNINFMYSGVYDSDKTTTPITSTPPIDKNFRANLRPYRVIWENVRIITSSEGPNDTIPRGKTLVEAIDKILNTLMPLGENDEPKYFLDPSIRSYISGMNSPELKFENQKSVYEALSLIGKEFYGIPRLGCEVNGEWQPNCITYDILNPKLLNSGNIDDEQFAENSRSSLENHNTGFISNISNMVDINNYAIFPPGDIWTTPRSGSETDPLANKDNMAIVVDKPIYRLIDILVKGFNTSDKNSYVSLRDYCLEKLIFDSLADTSTQKGKSIYYTSGTNKIEGLGRIPNATEFEAAMGLDPTEYTISRIISNIVGLSPSTINNLVNSLEYKVIYIPYTDAKIYTEQSNLTGLKNYNYKTLNQEDNIISAEHFGKSAQNQVSRLGNNSIEKTYLLNSEEMFDLPKLGDIKNYNGYSYYADIIRYVYNNNYSSATVSFSKNFNKINDRVGIDAAYRLYRIYANDFVDRSVNINKYCYISLGTGLNTEFSPELENLKNDLYDSYHSGIIKFRPDSLYVSPLKEDKKPLQYLDYSYGNTFDINPAVLPVSMNLFGNSIAFSAEFKDNFSAGIKLDGIYKKQGKQADVRYVNNAGECPKMELRLFNMDETSKRALCPLNNKDVTSWDTWPEVKRQDSSGTLSNTIYSDIINLDKDNRERIKFVYQLHMLTFEKNLTIHPAIFKNLYKDRYWGSEDISRPSIELKAYLVTEDVSKQLKLNSGNAVEIGIISSKTTNGPIKFMPTVSVIADKNYNSLVFVWNDNTILFSQKIDVAPGEIYTMPNIFINMSDRKIDNPN